jgi:hypothetical protein
LPEFLEHVEVLILIAHRLGIEAVGETIAAAPEKDFLVIDLGERG